MSMIVLFSCRHYKVHNNLDKGKVLDALNNHSENKNDTHYDKHNNIKGRNKTNHDNHY